MQNFEELRILYKFFSLTTVQNNTVKSVYKGHLRKPEKWPLRERGPYIQV